MPIPIFDFDEFDAIPRRAVPVRYACLVTNWTPGFLAERVLAMGELERFCRWLPVHEFDPADGVVYDVRLLTMYEKLLKLRTEPASPDELEQLPANHFVWADDLAEVYEKAVSATFDDLEYAPVIRWRVTPGDCKAVVAECPDLSSLAEIGSTDHQLHDKTLAEFPGTSEPSNDAASAPCFRRSGEGWTLTFEGKTTYVTNMLVFGTSRLWWHTQGGISPSRICSGRSIRPHRTPSTPLSRIYRLKKQRD